MGITIALPKGRLAKKTMKILGTLGIECPEMDDEETRKLIFTSVDEKYHFFLAKPTDVPTYVEAGVADLGVVGKDTIVEEDKDVIEMLDLGFGSCRMMVAGYEAKKHLLYEGDVIRIATKYPNVAKKYFESTNRNVEIIKLNGSVELGPIVGLADFIVDIVESGQTLKENGLTPLENIEPLSARLIVNKASLKVKYNEISSLIAKIEETNK